MCSANVSRRVAEQLHQPLVPVQRVGDEVPVEAADVRRREAEVEPHGARLELGRQRAALELGGHRAGQLAQHVDVVLGPRERRVVVDAQHADQRAPDLDRDAEERADGAVRLGDHRAARRRRASARTSASARGWRGATGVTGDLLVGADRDLRVRGTEQPRAQRGEPVERLTGRLGEQAARRLDPPRVIQARAQTIGVHPAAILGRFSARRAASASGSAPTSRSNGPTTVQIAFSRSRATASTGCTRASECSSAPVVERPHPVVERDPHGARARPRPRTPPARRAPGSRARASRSGRPGRRPGRARTPRAR